MSVVRIGLISDIHIGPDFGFQAGSRAWELLQVFAERMGDFRPDLIIDLGDRTNNVDRETDRDNLCRLAHFFAALPYPVAHVLGNHDLVNLDVDENTSVLKGQQTERVEEYRGWPFVFLNSENGSMPVEFLSKLEKAQLFPGGEDRRNRPCRVWPLLVFSHRPLLEVPLIRNRLFPPDEAQHTPWGGLVLSTLRKYGTPIICINGHLHWNHFAAFGHTFQVTIPSLVETWQSGEPAGSFAEAVLSEAGCEIHVRGRLPAHYLISFRD